MRKRIAKGVIFLSIMIILTNCIEQIEVFTESTPALVIDGVITNEPGPQRVKLSITTAYNAVPDYREIEGANVAILDDLGHSEPLSYAGNGIYATSKSFSGVVGRSYQLKVTLKSGKQYESTVETLKEAPPINNLYYKEKGTGLAYSVDFTDDAEETNFYRWRYNAVYEVIAPKSADLVNNPPPGLIQLPPASCFSGPKPNPAKVWKCWVSESDMQYLNVEEDRFFNGRSLTQHPITTMELSLKYDRGYLFNVKLYNLSKDAYDYWKALEGQIGNNGTIFETANYQILGNVSCISDEKEIVLGYFGASGVSTASVMVQDFAGTFEQISCAPNNSGCYPERCWDCLKFSPTSTNVKPTIWP